MYCINCGTQLPDDANFCSNCGMSPRALEQQKETKFESCEIIYIQVQPWNWENIRKFKFVAEAIGVNGKYNVFETATIGTKDDDTKKEQYGILVDEIVELLLQDGWEASETRGENWWNYRFKRKWNPTQIKWEVCDVSAITISGWKVQGKFGAFILGKVDEKGNRKLIEESPLYKGRPQVNLSKTSSEIKDVYTGFIEHLQKDGWEQVISKTGTGFKYSPILSPMTMQWDFLMSRSNQDWVRKRFRRRIETND